MENARSIPPISSTKPVNMVAAVQRGDLGTVKKCLTGSVGGLCGAKASSGTLAILEYRRDSGGRRSGLREHDAPSRRDLHPSEYSGQPLPLPNGMPYIYLPLCRSPPLFGADYHTEHRLATPVGQFTSGQGRHTQSTGYEPKLASYLWKKSAMVISTGT